MRNDGITEGLIGVLTCIEPCRSFQLRKNAKTRRLELAWRVLDRASVGWWTLAAPIGDCGR
ncbi:MAG TPA: hypothetical protein VN641_17655 [Urbifossiella sp.]|nr:hypothetical protein [Urbifossiella sp.]